MTNKERLRESGRKQAYETFCLMIACRHAEIGGNYYFKQSGDEFTLVVVDKYGVSTEWYAGTATAERYIAYREAMKGLLESFFRLPCQVVDRKASA